jgi:lipid-binding SYLF domain-containing protein
VLNILWEDNGSYYGQPNVTVDDIFAGRVAAPESAMALRNSLANYAP